MRVNCKLGGAFIGATLFLALLPLAAHAGGDEGKTHKIVIEEFSFMPEAITVRVGDSVEWVNTDPVPHTATEKNRAWDTDMMRKNEIGKMTFTTPGVIEYKCDYHPIMSGKIIVEE